MLSLCYLITRNNFLIATVLFPFGTAAKHYENRQLLFSSPCKPANPTLRRKGLDFSLYQNGIHITQIRDSEVVDGVQVMWYNRFADGSEAEAKITGYTVPAEVGGFGLVCKGRERARNKMERKRVEKINKLHGVTKKKKHHQIKLKAQTFRSTCTLIVSLTVSEDCVSLLLHGSLVSSRSSALSSVYLSLLSSALIISWLPPTLTNHSWLPGVEWQGRTHTHTLLLPDTRQCGFTLSSLKACMQSCASININNGRHQKIWTIG